MTPRKLAGVKQPVPDTVPETAASALTLRTTKAPSELPLGSFPQPVLMQPTVFNLNAGLAIYCLHVTMVSAHPSVY